MTTKSVLLIGASVRALAQSVHQAGWQSLAFDLFQDRDLQTRCPSTRISFADYPKGIPAILQPYAGLPICYTGGLENYPELFDCLVQQHPILGNLADTLRKVRDPFYLQQLASQHHLHFPATDRTVPSDGNIWLCKPLQSAGGHGIDFVTVDTPIPSTHYVQQYLSGGVFSSLWCAGNQDLTYIGSTQQLSGIPELHAQPFQYAGNIGPMVIQQKHLEQVSRWASLLQQQTGLKGLFGLDWLLVNDHVYLLEVNPRYTAAMELWERSSNFSCFALHLAAFGLQETPTPPLPHLNTQVKGIVYAKQEVIITSGLQDWFELQKHHLADLPHLDDLIQTNWPICTIFADSLGKLTELAEQLYAVAEKN